MKPDRQPALSSLRSSLGIIGIVIVYVITPHFLSVLAMMRKYAPEDLPIGGDWLVYGTALGVGDKVEQAMKALNIPVADTGVPLGVMGMSMMLLPITSFMPVSQGGPRGGFGGGGGFGGWGPGEGKSRGRLPAAPEPARSGIVMYPS